MFRIAPMAAIVLLLVLLAACGEATPSPTVSATPTARPAGSGETPIGTPALREPFEQLTYTGPDGAIRLVDANGANDHVFIEEPCNGSSSAWRALPWARDGERFTYLCPHEQDFTLVVVDADGLEIARAEQVDTYKWSPDGRRVAMQRHDGEWPDQTFEVSLLDVSNLAETVLAKDAQLLEWVGGEHVMLGRDLEFGGFDFLFDAYLHDVSGASEPMPRFDNQREFWVAPDGATAIVLTEWDEERSGFRMAVYEFGTGEETDIEGSAIGYPSEHIPDAQLAFSPDASTIYWTNANEEDPALWRASTAGGPAQLVASIGTSFAVVSPGGRVAYWGQPPEPDAPETGQDVLTIEDAVGGGRVAITRGSGVLAWRTPHP